MSFAYGFGLPHWQPLSGAFSPLSLFSGGVQGAFYDPSDATTLFSDRAGTTPCGTPGGGSVVPVGAMLDKRAAGYSVFFDGTGDYLSFASDSGLALGAGQYTVELLVYLTASVNFGVFFSVTGGFQFGTNASNNLAVALQGVAFQLESTTPVTLNQWAHLAVTRDSGNTTRIFLNGSQIASAVITTNYGQGVSYANFNAGLPSAQHTGYYANLRVVKGTAVYTGNFTPPTSPLSPITGTSLLTCGTSWTGNPAITKNGDARVDGLNPFQASPVGNHAIAANDTTARPELRARVNLLTYSEQFDNGVWTKFRSSVTTNAAVAPDGTTTAEKLVPNAGLTQGGIYNATGVTTSVATTYTASVYVKAAELGFVFVAVNVTASYVAAVCVNLATGAQSNAGGSGTYNVTNVGNGWWRVTCTVAATVATGYLEVFPLAAAGTQASYTGDGTSGIFIWGAQLTATNEFPANTYQRISDANTYDAVGFPRYLVANGTSSAMSTPGNVNLSGTDKVTVFAGVRKLSDGASYPTLAELSANITTNNGSFAIYTNGGSTPRYPVYLQGTAQTGYEPQTYTAPISNVLAISLDIGGALRADEVAPRINGVLNQTNFVGTANAGTGNFGSYPLFIGARNNSSFFLNGNLYSLIVVGSAVSAGQISATEQWVAQRTGITL